MTTLQKPIRIEVATTVFDSRAQTLKNKLADLELSNKIDSKLLQNL